MSGERPGDSLANYRYQPLPILSSSRKQVEGPRLSCHLPVNLPAERINISHPDIQFFIKAAFGRLILLYLETQDFLFGEVKDDTRAPTSAAAASTEDLDEATRFLKFFRFQVARNSVPPSPLRTGADNISISEQQHIESFTWLTLINDLKSAAADTSQRNYVNTNANSDSDGSPSKLGNDPDYTSEPQAELAPRKRENGVLDPASLANIRERIGLDHDSKQFPFPVIFSWGWADPPTISEHGLAKSCNGARMKNMRGRWMRGIAPLGPILELETFILGATFLPIVNPNEPPDESSAAGTNFSSLILHFSVHPNLMSMLMLRTFAHQAKHLLEAILKNPEGECNIEFVSESLSGAFDSPNEAESESMESLDGMIELDKSSISVASSVSEAAGTESSEDSLSLLSSYTHPLYEAELARAQHPLKWLTLMAHDHPDRVAHEIYTADDLRAHEEDDGEHEEQGSLKPSVMLTYGELNRRANAVAKWLLSGSISKSKEKQGERGNVKVKREKICVCMERDAAFYVIMAAIWKAGGIYCSIDPTLPVERKRYIVKDSGSKLVFVHTPEEREALLSEFEDEDEAPIVSILEDEYDLERCEPVFELSLRWGSVEEMDVEESGLDDVSYLLYTSGTTGKPKGCLLTYRGVYHAITGLADLPRPITNPETDKRLAMASIAFDVHISEIVISWALGIRLVSAPSARFELLSDLRRNIWRLGVTHLGMVPSMIEATFQAGNSRGGAEEGKKVGLKYLASGGEKISDSLMERWSDHPSLILANAYGPTEATIGCTLRRVHKNDRKENLGWPMKSCRTFVVHPSSGSESPFMVVPRGVPGELVLAGPLVGVGYHNNKEATRKAFIEWPEKGAMAYRTGDLVRMMPDGALEILGRVDSQIKLRGVRIEAEGISNVLREAAAAASDDPRMGYVTVTIIATHLGFGGGGNEQLVTFIARGGDKKRQMQRRKSGVLPDVLPLSQDSVVSSSSFPLEIMAKIKEASSKELASYMRPSHIIPIAYIPLNPSGKTDGKLLRSLFSSTDVSTLLRFQRGEEGMRIISDGTNGDEGDGDEDAEERFKSQTYGDLSNILREILPAQSVTLKSNLFEAGLDSFGFGALSRLIKKKLLPPGCKPIRVAELMSFSDLRQLVSAIDETRRAPSKSPSAANPQPNPYSNEPEGEKESLITAFDEKWRASAEGIFNPGDIECVLPPLPVQEGVLFRTLQQPGHYVQHFSYRCSDVIDIRRVEDAWKRLVEQTQILRSCFVVGDTLLQVVLTPQAATLPFSEHEVSSMTVDEFIEWFRVNAAQKIAEDITDDVTVPLFRVNLYTSEEAKYMVLSINHVAYDGISIPVMLRNLACHYEGLQVEHPSPTLQSVLEELPFLDSDGARRFWTSQLDSIKAHYHARHLSPPKPPMREHLLSDLSYSNITQRCRSLGISFQALCTAAYGIVHRNTFHLGEDQSLFGVVRSGRSLAVDNINFAICPLVCVVPTLVDFGVTDTTQLLRNVQRFISETTSYEHMSVGRIRRWIGGSSLPIDSLFSCRFKFRSEPVCSDAFQHINTEHPLAEFILSIEILVDADADTLDIRAAFTEPELSLEGVRTFLQALEKTVEDLISSPPPGIVELVPSGHGSLAPTPASEPEGSSAEHAIPSAELEETVAGHVCQLLRVQKKIVRPTTSLISIGLDSLRSVALSRMLSEDGIDVSAVDIVQADSIRKLLQRQSLAKRSHEPSLESFAEIRRIRQELENALKDQDLKLSPEDETLIIPATSLQAGMLSQTLASKGELYVHGFTFRLDSCEIDAVRKSWTRAIRRFDILRTSFHFAPVSGRWAQVIHTDADVRWSTKHYSDSANFVEDLTRSLSFKDPIDFSRSPLHLRLAVLHEENYLVVVLHHVLYDAVSLPKLFSFVRQDLMGASTSAIPPQLQDIIDDVLVQETDGANFWADSLKGFHPPHISRDRSVSSDAWRSSLTLDLDSAVIDRTCRRYQISSQSIMQLAWAKVLANRYQNVDVVFGQVVSGRALPKAMDVVAPLFNTVPMRVKFYKGRTNKDMVRTVHQFNIAAIPWQHASLRTVQKRIGVSNICDTLFLFQPNVTEEDDRGTRPLELAHKEAGEVSKTQYALNVEVSPLFRGYNISASCSSQVMDLDALKRTLKEFSGAIFDIVNRPNESALPLSFSFNERGSEHAIPDHPITDGEPEEWWTEERLLLRDVVSKFASVLPESILAKTDLVSIGIDSISAIQISSAAKRVGLGISSSDVASSTAFGDLSFRLKSHPGTFDTHGREPRQSCDLRPLVDPDIYQKADSILPASAGMEWLIASWQRSEGRLFHHAFVFEFEGKMNPGKVRSAWNTLAQHHHILRSTFVPSHVKGSTSYYPVIVSYKHQDPEWLEQSLEANAADELSALKQLLSNAMISLPSIAKVPTRLTYVHGTLQDYFIINLHHFAYDAWSLRLIMNDFRMILNDQSPQFGNNLSGFLFRSEQSETRSEIQRRYWQGLFRNRVSGKLFPHLNRPSCDESSNDNGQIMLRCFVFEDAIHSLESKERRAQELGLPLHLLLLASWGIVQQRYSTSRNAETADGDVVFGLWHSGRLEESEPPSGLDIPNLAVPTVNILPVRVEYHKDSENLVAAAAKNLRLQLQQRSSVIEQSRWVDVVRWIAETQDASHPRLCNVFVNLLKPPHRLEHPLSYSFPSSGSYVSFKAIKFPYSPSSRVKIESSLLRPRYDITEVVQPDLLVDIFLNPANDTIGISFECEHTLVGEDHAKDFVADWATMLDSALR